MASGHERQVRALLAEAESIPADEREQFLRQRAGTDELLRDVLRQLFEEEGTLDEVTLPLASGGSAFVELFTPETVGPTEAPQLFEVPARGRPGQVDRYEILRQLGSGGSGLVYEALQLEPRQRRVALKLIRDAYDPAGLAARLATARTGLLALDHPGVARIFDAGVTDSGRPYLVMELVEGVALTEHCDRHRLTVAERLRLFAELCGAVQHCHQKGLVHGDLKPSNVLVQDDAPSPTAKLIDFGFPREVEAGATWGTPAYMSPEQMGLTGQDVDTRSDVFSLGVVLFELLCGTLPWKGPEDSGEMLDQALARKRTIPPPSQSLEQHGAELDAVAAYRSTDPEALRDALAGELDELVLEATAVDREERPPTAHELARRIQEILAR